MLQITLKATTFWDEKNEEFVDVKEDVIYLEHSLVSISKWESYWKVPYFSAQKKLTRDQAKYYVMCMSTKPLPTMALNRLTSDDYKKIAEYIQTPQTATTVKPSTAPKKNDEGLTSELIYYYMFQAQIPKECEKWHFSRLQMLLEIAGAKSQPPKKMSEADRARRNSSINAKRRAKAHSKG